MCAVCPASLFPSYHVLANRYQHDSAMVLVVYKDTVQWGESFSGIAFFLK